MENQAIQDLRRLIESSKPIVNFGTPAHAVGAEWFEKAERALGWKLSDSYKWFLKNYAGGEIGGEEIYSIYGQDFETVNGGDIVFHHLINRKNGFLDSNKVVVSTTDLGETFFFDYTKFDGSESPIYLRLPSGRFVPYAQDFYEFLKKRIDAQSADARDK